MSVLRRGFESVYVSDELREGMRRQLRVAGGLVLLASAAGLGIALATWSAQDPSFTHATKSPVRNLLGLPGAAAADLLMQVFGIASTAFLMPLAVWGWRLLGRRPLNRERLRVGGWVFGALGASLFAACLPPSAHWPLPSGLGGVIGDGLLWLASFASGGAVGEIGRTVLAAVSGVFTLLALGIAAGLGMRSGEPQPRKEITRIPPEPDADRRGWFLGMLAHTALSARARMTRLLAWLPGLLRAREDAVEAPERVTQARRIEPRWEHGPTIDEETELEAEPEPVREVERRPAPAPVTVAEPRKARPPTKVGTVSTVTSAQAVAPRPTPAVKREPDGYEFPPLTLLASPKPNDRASLSKEQIQENAASLESVLDDFGVRGQIINAHPGPVVTLYELEPAPGIKSSRVIGLSDDIARSMSAVSARVAVVSGRNAIGIELPNPRREKVLLRELLASTDYTETSAKLPLCLGKTIGGEPVIVDLARMPHLLIAGTTGSGKSVAINTMILSLLFRLTPEQCRVIMVDPKMLELSVYDGIPHLLTPVVTDPKKAVIALKWAVREMEDRYRKMSKLGVRNVEGYNLRVAEAKAKSEALTRTVHTGYDKESGEAIYEEEALDLEALPLIVVVVDEMADLMMVAGKDIEGAIQRLAQMARAAGIHVILATQRPSVDVITGTIKANFPTRISFQVTSKIDSRTILGEQGAEQLLGQGDMLYMAGGGRISRVHGPFCSDEEVEKVVRHLKAQGQPQYLDAVTAGEDDEESGDAGAVFDATEMGEGADPYALAVQIVLRDRKASTSYIQRRMQIGYNRAASLMEKMEKEGIVGPANHAGKREILVGEDAEG